VRSRLAVGVAAVLAFLLLGLPVAAGGERPNAADLEAEFVCPVCKTTLDQSNAPVAERMKAFIRERIAAGDTEPEIRGALVAQFGPGVLATPRKGGFGLLAWLVPLVAIIGAGIALAVLIRGWSSRRAETPIDEPPVDLDLERRLDEELARFDA
jgi:cytochrome c-type biogenesis protein CcmH